MLKVTVAEVNRTAACSIGADLSVAGGSTGFFSLLPGAAGLGATGRRFWWTAATSTSRSTR